MTAKGKHLVRLDELAAKINEKHAACTKAMQDGLCYAVEAGKLLIEAKARHEHGGWLRWVGKNCQFKTRLAQKYMQVAREYPKLTGTNTPRMAHLGFGETLRLLATPRLPDVVAQQRQAGDTLMVAAEVKIRAEREAGRLLADLTAFFKVPGWWLLATVKDDQRYAELMGMIDARIAEMEAA